MTSALYIILPAALSLAIACAILSVLVVSRRWAFIGEGIGHSGFGGAGTAWMLSLIFPIFNQPWAPYTCAFIFCLLTALGIGLLSHRQRINSDAAVGIFMVASLAWGFLGREIYLHHHHSEPLGFDTLLFGETARITCMYAITAILLSAVVIILTTALSKEILSYCFDPLMAEASGVATTFIHYLLLLLIALTIVVGMRIVGTVLVTALLVLPGATGLLISPRLRNVLLMAITTAVIAAALGVLLNFRFSYIPAGPTIVLILFVQFLVCFVVSAIKK